MCTNPIKINVKKETGIEEITIKCGKCPTCQREKASEWAIKLINEAKYHKKACFITLTFDNKILLDRNSKAHKYGANASFVFNINNSKEYFKKFIKRLRKHYKDKAITFFHVGEYGEKTKRPHHHCIIYGINFEEDRREIEKSKSGKTQYFSKTLFDLWACGRISVQDLNTSNTIYICQYSLKKFKNNIHNKKYRPIMSFSNRSKYNVKWCRRNYEQIAKGYLEDKDGKKYRIPKSYLKNLSEDKGKRRKAYEEYEEKLYKRIYEGETKEFIKQQKIKEEIIAMREREKSRDF